MRFTDKTRAVAVPHPTASPAPLVLWSDTGVFDLYIHRGVYVSGELYVSNPDKVQATLTLTGANQTIINNFMIESSPAPISRTYIEAHSQVHLEVAGGGACGLSLEVVYG